MSKTDYDDPETEERWCEAQRENVTAYLQSQRVEPGRIGVWPAWHIAPYAAVWAIESRIQPGAIGWWVISGDLPTDYTSSADIEPPQHPRKAVRVIAARWLNQVEAWAAGREFEGIRIGGPNAHRELAPLLESRARLLLKWADDDSLWEE